MELLGLAIVLLVIVLAFLFGSKDKRRGQKTRQSKQSTRELALDFGSPIPKGFQIYAKRIPIAGIQYRRDDALAFARASSQRIQCQLEPTNEHDPNAIRLLGLSSAGSHMLGYVPRDLSAQLASTALADQVQARLMRIYVSGNGYINVDYQILGPKVDKKRFDDYTASLPAGLDQKEYLDFFKIEFKRGITNGEAQVLIAEHDKTVSEERKAEWNSYGDILREFEDEDFSELYDVRKVSRSKVKALIRQMNTEGSSYQYLYDNIEEIVERAIESDASLRKNTR